MSMLKAMEAALSFKLVFFTWLKKKVTTSKIEIPSNPGNVIFLLLRIKKRKGGETNIDLFI